MRLEDFTARWMPERRLTWWAPRQIFSTGAQTVPELADRVGMILLRTVTHQMPTKLLHRGVNTGKKHKQNSQALNTHWTGKRGRPYVHADLHYVLYVNGTTVFSGTDGGVARTTNSGTFGITNKWQYEYCPDI